MPGHIFISYSHEDKDYVARLAEYLRDESLPVWRDNLIDRGAQWESVVRDKVETCGVLIAVMTPEARRSDWVTRELAWAKNKEKPIVPLLRSGKAFDSLKDLQFEDITGDRVPSADLMWRLRELTGQPHRVIEVQSAQVQGGHAEFVVTFGRRFSFYHVFLDTDGDDSTGFQVPGRNFGANYMIENVGLWQSQSGFWDWRPIDEVKPLVSDAGKTYRWRLPLSALGLAPGAALRALAHGAQEDGRYDEYGSIVTAAP